MPIPDSFGVSAAIEAMCRAEGLANPHTVFPDFRDWALAERIRKVDWEATFRRWMRDPRTSKRYPAWADEPRTRPPQEPTPTTLTEEQVARYSDPEYQPEPFSFPFGER